MAAACVQRVRECVQIMVAFHNTFIPVKCEHFVVLFYVSVAVWQQSAALVQSSSRKRVVVTLALYFALSFQHLGHGTHPPEKHAQNIWFSNTQKGQGLSVQERQGRECTERYTYQLRGPVELPRTAELNRNGTEPRCSANVHVSNTCAFRFKFQVGHLAKVSCHMDAARALGLHLAPLPFRHGGVRNKHHPKQVCPGSVGGEAWVASQKCKLRA